MSSIFLLTGWGVGGKCLRPLADELSMLGYHVTLNDLPYLVDAKEWLTCITEQLPVDSYWVGWSLGGQLLSQLTTLKTKQCLGLITLGSNVCFKTKKDWPYAMDEKLFETFKHSYKSAPEQTLKRFLQLVAQGSWNSKHVVRTLQQSAINPLVKEGSAGLDWLDSLDTRDALKQFSNPQYHLLAEKDALLPITCFDAMNNLLPHALVELVENTGHAFVVQEYALVAQKIHQFIRVNL